MGVGVGKGFRTEAPQLLNLKDVNTGKRFAICFDFFHRAAERWSGPAKWPDYAPLRIATMEFTSSDASPRGMRNFQPRFMSWS